MSLIMGACVKGKQQMTLPILEEDGAQFWLL